jgi:cell division septum initiation protein DivIVA
MKGRENLVQDGRGRQDLVQVGGAADRAGAMVTDQVRSIIEAAEKKADEIRLSAERDAEQIRQQAAEAADRILGRLDAIEEPLFQMVSSLRSEADSLSAHVSRR